MVDSGAAAAFQQCMQKRTRLNIFKALGGLSSAMQSAIFDHATSNFWFISFCLSENFQCSQRLPVGPRISASEKQLSSGRLLLAWL
jgi:hypothetical protein